MTTTEAQVSTRCPGESLQSIRYHIDTAPTKRDAIGARAREYVWVLNQDGATKANEHAATQPTRRDRERVIGIFGGIFTLDKPGRRYQRVLSHAGGMSVHAFIDLDTGDVLKPAGWQGPAKIVRYNLLDDESRQAMYHGLDQYGLYLYDAMFPAVIANYRALQASIDTALATPAYDPVPTELEPEPLPTLWFVLDIAENGQHAHVYGPRHDGRLLTGESAKVYADLCNLNMRRAGTPQHATYRAGFITLV